MRDLKWFVGIILGLLALAACSLEGRPRIGVEASSPDGSMTAFVKNHYTFDGPDQSIWLRQIDGAKVKLRRLSADQDWCNLILWSEDGSRVAFLIQDARLLIYEPATSTAATVVDEWLVEQDGYPTIYRVRDLELSEDGTAATFRRCRRRGTGCSDEVRRFDARSNHGGE